ncbi:hypothetical protein HOY80DRAFT_858580, partial [Tuber brumale]
HSRTDPLPSLSRMLKNSPLNHPSYSNLDRVFCPAPHDHHSQRNAVYREYSRE